MPLMKKIVGGNSQSDSFRNFTVAVSRIAGHPMIFLLSIVAILVWLFLGIVFNFSDTWQLVLNTITSIITFLMVFIIQNSESRENTRLNLKLDELIRSHQHACNSLMGVEALSDHQLEELSKTYDGIGKGKIDPQSVKQKLDQEIAVQQKSVPKRSRKKDDKP